MTRVTFVKAARKDNPAQGIKAGESYWWWSKMVGGRGVKFYSKTKPRRSQLTNSAFRSQFYEIEDRLQDVAQVGDADAVCDELESIADDLTTLGEDEAEKVSNMEDNNLGESPSCEICRSRADACENIADAIRSAVEMARDELEALDDDDDDSEGDDSEQDAKQERIDAKRDKIAEDLISEAQASWDEPE